MLRIQELIDQILQKHSETLSELVLPSEVVETLYTEGVFSNETFDEVTKLGGSLSGGPLRALSDTVSKDFKQLRLFAMVLQQSEDTVGIAKDILNEYGKWFLLYNCIISYVCTDQTQMSVFPQSQSGILYDTLLYCLTTSTGKIFTLQRLENGWFTIVVIFPLVKN